MKIESSKPGDTEPMSFSDALLVWQPDGFSGWHSLILSARVAELLLAHRSIDQAKHGSNRKCRVPISRPCLSQQGKDKMAAKA